MSHLNEWVLMIARQLRSEAERITSMAKSELYEDAAKDTFVRVVLEPFLPTSYSVGTGKVFLQIIDEQRFGRCDQGIVTNMLIRACARLTGFDQI